MCGILFAASGLRVVSEDSGEEHVGQLPEPEAISPALEDFMDGLRCRGPDDLSSCTVQCDAASLRFVGSLLQLRGTEPSSGVLRDAATGDVLLFNGQVFGGGLAVPPQASDSRLLLQALSRSGADVAALLAGLRGPWALVFWQHATRTLWFGRDPIGRRSLLLHLPRLDDGRLLLSSCSPLDPLAPFHSFAELPPGLYSLRAQPCSNPAAAGGKVTALLARHEWADPFVRRLLLYKRAPGLGEPGSPSAGEEAAAEPREGGVEAGGHDPAFERSVDAVLAALRHAVAVRCRCIEQQSRHGRGDEGATQPSRLNGGQLPGLEGGGGAAEPGASEGAAPAALQPPAPVLVLFSGGVDSTLLAALAHEALPTGAPVDLASLCFDGGASPDRLAALDALAELRARAPDRPWRLLRVDCGLGDVAAARGRLLRLLAPADTVMDLNIGAALWLAARGQGGLLGEEGADGEPTAAESQGPALAGGEPGLLQRGQDATAEEQRQRGEPEPATLEQQQAGGGGHEEAGSSSGCRPPRQASPRQAGPVRSAARVVLLGHGADELCGGYGRHRTAFRAGGWAGLEAELALDLGRLWLRNLGRDDRLVADHGREARHPFLDEGVVAAVLAAPLHHAADLRLPPGAGDKRLLRACLRRLGLPRAAQRAKRAIQFGTRLAAKANAAQFGGTRRANAANAGSVRLADVPPLGALNDGVA